MSQPTKGHKFVEAPQLTSSEQRKIDQKIEFETAKSFHSMVKLGAFANIFGALLYVLAIYSSTRPILIISWYILLVIANLLNVLWALRFEYSHITHKEIIKCRQGFLYIVILICLIWSSIGILFMNDGIDQKMTTVIFLSAVLICFSFSTALDLTMGIVSIVCLLTPTLLYHLYLIIDVSHSKVNNVSTSITGAFLVLGIFMLIACFVGNRIILKLFRLGYENALLSRKLENMNASLEQRVKERTDALEKSLKLVTYQATHDLLTDLPNERLLYDHIQGVTERAIRDHQKFAIACFSLNNMMKINDSIGHQASATIIHRIAQRFAHLAEKNKKYFISLLRKDVFVILINPVMDALEIEECTQDLFVVLENPVYVAQQELNLTASIGLSVFPSDGRDVDTLITNAEAARTLATERGGNSIRIFNTVITADASRQLNIENHLYHAIENNELILNYQPFIDLRTGTVCGAEALLRWKSPILGLLSPMEFIPLAEANGMILPIGEWVLSTACKQLKKWHNSGFQLAMSVNLSAKQLIQHDVVERIGEILNKLKLSPKYLELELTESNAFQNEAIPIINKFTEMGIALAIDDFGTGYSEFGNLKLFKVNKIKIDKTFIQDIEVSIDSRNIVINTIALAHRMNIDCLAEGVETLEQIKFLKENGCYIMQGFYFSQPLDTKDFTEFLKTHSKNTYTALTHW
ncbi:GGDEF domain-containing phosphodiesterase [Legionella anisa]|uniref:Phosphodiesterase n=1 Tax=Legionella anisa TaxID=28082 RepID=A0AAX0X143_9GAMM|nr:GGDEF domain-containing phosphodiesterase [Legionella anisa]AWN72507.1 phosphodiesterase [Legionella anisa]KTC74730.1 inner membrane protein/sensory box protein LssE [Legionella anisa]MCW8423276.1 EAL domain-containing protein [Legionella anisa]MCW8446795.1 EAL domain-containing protein [Legionella anisa]PNL62959.1 phosphodiesterase [Legionella anisa]